MKALTIKIIQILNFQLQAFGFSNTTDYLDSTFHTKTASMFNVVTAASMLGWIAVCLEEYVGLSPVVYLAFVGLLVGEFLSGVGAAMKQGIRIRSRKFGRMIIKIGTYTVILGIVHSFKIGLESQIILGTVLNVYEWIYYMVLNLIIIQLLISLFENLEKLGWTESSIIIRVIKIKFDKWFTKNDEKQDPKG
jgi:hypothetical protein